MVERNLVEEVYLLISIMQFPMSEDVKIKICTDLVEKGLAISQILFVVDRNLRGLEYLFFYPTEMISV